MALSKGDLHLCMENHLAHCDVLREAGFVIVLKKVYAVKFFDFSNQEKPSGHGSSASLWSYDIQQ